MRLNKVLETDFLPIKSTDTLGTLVKTIAKAKRNLFPVIGSKGQLKGIVLLDDIRGIMFEEKLYNKVTVASLMHNAPDIIYFEKDSIEKIMKKFKSTDAWNLPVIKDGKYLGFISRSRLLTAYRRKLIEVTV